MQPFHEGEIAVQMLAGERELADATGGMIAQRIPVGGRPFLAERPLLIAGGAGADGALWAEPWSGAPGFVRSTADGRGVVVEGARDVGAAQIVLAEGTELGLLAIDLATRRRLRINGAIAHLAGDRLELAVAEAYPNCPKYITRRTLAAPAPATAAATATGTALDAARLATLARTDTAFVASRHPRGHTDASHRGGPAGFITALSPTTLEMPDYPGNGMFQTLGNLAIDPHVGVSLLDFAGGRLLEITGTAALAITPDADTRHMRIHIDRWIEIPLAMTGTEVVR